ncbi:MAG: MxaK protein [Methylovirgula sp.]
MTILRLNHPRQSVAAWIAAVWGRIKTRVLVALVGILGLATVAAFGLCGVQVVRNRTIAAIMHNRDVAVSQDAASKLQFARAYFLITHRRLDDAQAVVSLFDLHGSAKARAGLHYDLANGRLRAAFDKIDENDFDAAGALVGLAQADYIESLRLHPDDWNARFNFDVATRLVRQYPSFMTYHDPRREGPHPIWTELPNVPRGEP